MRILQKSYDEQCHVTITKESVILEYPEWHTKYLSNVLLDTLEEWRKNNVEAIRQPQYGIIKCRWLSCCYFLKTQDFRFDWDNARDEFDGYIREECPWYDLEE